MSTPAQTPRRELFVFTLRGTTHGSLSTHNVQAVKWDLAFDKPDLTQLFAYSFMERQARTGMIADLLPTGTAAVFQAIVDYSHRDQVRLDRDTMPFDRRTNHSKSFGPYWVLLPVADCSKHHGSYYARFHNWACDIKRQVKPKSVDRLLQAFSPYLIFNKETDDEIAGLSEAGTCPVREWNRDTFGWSPGYR